MSDGFDTLVVCSIFPLFYELIIIAIYEIGLNTNSHNVQTVYIITYKIPCSIFLSSASHISTMPPRQSTLGYIELVPSNVDEEHSSPHGAGGASSSTSCS
jgi:hypothetical protein